MTPNEWLAKVTSGMPGAVWRKLDEMRAERGRKLPDWPDWCFLPFHGWYALTSMMTGKDRLALEETALMQALAVAGTWRVTQAGGQPRARWPSSRCACQPNGWPP